MGQQTPGDERPCWTVQVALADLKRRRTFRFPEDDVGGYAMLFAFDADRGQNELSSSEEEARGRITFRMADCHDFRISAHLGSDFF